MFVLTYKRLYDVTSFDIVQIGRPVPRRTDYSTTICHPISGYHRGHVTTQLAHWLTNHVMVTMAIVYMYINTRGLMENEHLTQHQNIIMLRHSCRKFIKETVQALIDITSQKLYSFKEIAQKFTDI